MIAKSTESPPPPAAGAACDATQATSGPHGLGLLLARCRKRLWTAAHQELVQHGDTVWTWQVLTHLEWSGPLTQNEVATSTGQHPAAVSRLLVELEGLGLVRRRRDARDQRRILAELTRRGRDRLEAVRPRMDQVIDQQFAAFSADELAELRRLLGKLAGCDKAPAAPASAGPAKRKRRT